MWMQHGVTLKMYQRQAIQTGVDVLQRHGGLILADEVCFLLSVGKYLMPLEVPHHVAA